MNFIEYHTDFFIDDPVKTEFYAFQCLKQEPLLQNCNYLAVPWSPLINRNKLNEFTVKKIKGGFTVCHHIRYKEIIPLLKKIGIDTLFTPHADGNDKGMRVFSFPHYAMNGVQPAAVKDIFYSFVGADTSSYIGSSLRRTIFEMQHPKEAFIKERKSWHWIRESGAGQLSREEQGQERKEYEDILARSRFSLCPRGTGGGTIRFWESLQAGAIPVLISDNLELPEGIDWGQCIVGIKERDVLDIPTILKNIPGQRETDMRLACIEAYKKYSGHNFVSVIRKIYNIKIYSFYTSHNKILFDQWFKPSFKDNFEIVFTEGEQKNYSGNYKEEGWFDLMGQKVDYIIKAIKDNWGELFFYADPDIQFFAPIERVVSNIYNNEDMIFQKDSPDGIICMGFILCKAGPKTLKFWQRIRMSIGKNNKCDQDLANIFLRDKMSFLDKIFNTDKIKWRYFPDEFFSGGTLTGKQWFLGNKLEIPRNILLHHANWTVGLQNKIAQLEYVRDIVEKQASH